MSSVPPTPPLAGDKLGQRYISLATLGCRWKCLGVRATVVGVAGRCRNDEFGGGNRSSRIGVRDMLSYQLCNYASPGRLLSQENTPPETHADLIRHSDGYRSSITPVAITRSAPAPRSFSYLTVWRLARIMVPRPDPWD